MRPKALSLLRHADAAQQAGAGGELGTISNPQAYFQGWRVVASTVDQSVTCRRGTTSRCKRGARQHQHSFGRSEGYGNIMPIVNRSSMCRRGTTSRCGRGSPATSASGSRQSTTPTRCCTPPRRRSPRASATSELPRSVSLAFSVLLCKASDPLAPVLCCRPSSNEWSSLQQQMASCSAHKSTVQAQDDHFT